MKVAVALLCLFLFAPAVFGAEPGAASARSAQRGQVKKSEKGLFALELAVAGGGLKTGANSLDLMVRDKNGKPVEGARLNVLPWLPEKNHGVWDKPVVSERGAGKYRVDNVAIAIPGRWDLKVAVKKEALEDQAVFPFTVARQEAPAAAAPAKADKPRSYERSLHRYVLPNVTLLNQDGKKVNIREMVDSGKPVIIDFIYTTCNTICPVLSAGFANLRKVLGPEAEQVQLISLSIDPEHDRPEQMKKYLSRFKAGKGWDFLTGSKEDIHKVLQALDAVVPDKMAHEPIYLLHGPNSVEWVRTKGLMRKNDLLAELRSVEK